jgi:hypothetical protein
LAPARDETTATPLINSDRAKRFKTSAVHQSRSARKVYVSGQRRQLMAARAAEVQAVASQLLTVRDQPRTLNGFADPIRFVGREDSNK